MIEKRGWFERPFAALCVLFAAAVLSLFVIFNSEGIRENTGETDYRITLRHYGSDAREMETTAAVPLEDALSAIPGINRIVTVSENGRTRAYVNFRLEHRQFGSKNNYYYDAVREAAQKVYETLPSSAQRPELSSSGDFNIPFWTAAVYDSAGGEIIPDAALLERTIKPLLNSIEGVGDVEIAGPGIKEIVVSLDKEKTASLGLSLADISRFLGDNDSLFSGGRLNHNGLDIQIRVDGRYAQPENLGEILIPLGQGLTVRLDTIAEISVQEREAETLSRLNGIRTTVVSVTAASSADPGILSRKIKNEIEKLSALPLEFRVLEDRGAEESAAFKSVLAAALEASILVALSALFLGTRKYSRFHNAFVCAAAIPLVSIISAAFLSAAGFPVNRKFLAGLAIGIGCAADAVILSAEGFGRAKNPLEGKIILRGIWSPLVSGAITTAAALFPLMGIAGGNNDITVIAAALGTVTIISAVLSLTLLPPLFLWRKDRGRRESRRLFSNIYITRLLPQTVLKKLSREFLRLLAAVTKLCVKRPVVFPAVSFAVSVCAMSALFITGADTSGEWAEDSVYAQIEFEGGFLKEESDPLLASWALEIKKHPAVKDVQTGARTGSGYGLITFDPREAKTSEIRKHISSKKIPGAFVYIPEPSLEDRIWNITISGDDAEKCRELAANAASLCSASVLIKETVLNFKDGGPRLVLSPRRELLSGAGIPFSFPADTIRRGVHGPVVYKRIGGDGGETDVRVRFASRENKKAAPNGDEILNIPLSARGFGQEGLYVSSLMKAVRSNEAASIRRENRRRTASFSIRTGPGDPRFFREKVTELLENMELPPLYRIEFDPEAIIGAESLSGKIFNFFWAVLFCCMIIAAAEESFVFPLIVLSSVFPSLAVPVLALCLSGASVNIAAACALVAVTGMTVNASVISAGELRRGASFEIGAVYRALRRRMPALAATTATTIVGTLPFLFLNEGNNALVRTLAFVIVLGVGASFFCSLTLIPSLMNFYFKIISRQLAKIMSRADGAVKQS